MKMFICLTVSVLVVAVFSSCKRRSSGSASTTSESPWISSFSTITTAATNTYGSSYFVFGTKDSTGSLYLAGSTTNGWTVVKSDDSGVTWSLDSQLGSGNWGYQLAADSLGNVYNVGFSGNNGIIRKRDATTHTWTNVYSGTVHPGYHTYFQGVGVDSSDNIYATGSTFLHLASQDGQPDTGLDEWLVMKSTDHGATWNPVDIYYPADHGTTTATGVLVTTSGDIYVYGNTSLDHASLIRKSSDGGTTWRTVFEDIHCSIRTMKEWNGGFIINEDYYLDGNAHSIPHMRVRGTTDDFATLKTLDEMSFSGASSVFTGLMLVDSRNYVYYSGYYLASNTRHVILRVNRGDGNWTTIDDYMSAGGKLGASDLFFVGNKIFNTVDEGTSWSLRTATVDRAVTFTPASMSGGTDFVSPVPANAKRIFTTWFQHDGKFGDTPENAIVAADAFCNDDPRRPLWNPSATYKAMLANYVRRSCTTSNCENGGSSENLDWVLAPSTLYVSYEGATIGTTDASGIFPALSRSLVTNSVEHAWTGLSADPTDWTTDPYGLCDNWTINDQIGSQWGTAWNLRGSDLSETYITEWPDCNAMKTVICVEQ